MAARDDGLRGSVDELIPAGDAGRRPGRDLHDEQPGLLRILFESLFPLLATVITVHGFPLQRHVQRRPQDFPGLGSRLSAPHTSCNNPKDQDHVSRPVAIRVAIVPLDAPRGPAQC